MDAFRFIFSVSFADDLAQQQVGAIVAEKTLSRIKKYLQTRHAPTAASTERMEQISPATRLRFTTIRSCRYGMHRLAFGGGLYKVPRYITTGLYTPIPKRLCGNTKILVM